MGTFFVGTPFCQYLVAGIQSQGYIAQMSFSIMVNPHRGHFIADILSRAFYRFIADVRSHRSFPLQSSLPGSQIRQLTHLRPTIHREPWNDQPFCEVTDSRSGPVDL